MLFSVCVFCASSRGHDPALASAASAAGAAIARRGWRLVYGGGAVGLMGSLADGALAAGGNVVGVIPGPLAAREVAHAGLSDLRIVQSMHDRKSQMADLSNAFIALPGGFGTLEEFFEVVTWALLGIHRAPCGLLNFGGHYDALLAFLDQCVERGLIRPEHRGLVLAEREMEPLLDRVASYVAPPLQPWLAPQQR